MLKVQKRGLPDAFGIAAAEIISGAPVAVQVNKACGDKAARCVDGAVRSDAFRKEEDPLFVEIDIRVAEGSV